MQADFWDSTIFLGDGTSEVARAGAPRAQQAWELSRRISRELLFPQGRVGAWLLFVVTLFAFVVFEALRVLNA
jgi:L-asparagine transporter-like permease